MSDQIRAKYLSGNDIGRTVSFEVDLAIIGNTKVVGEIFRAAGWMKNGNFYTSKRWAKRRG